MVISFCYMAGCPCRARPAQRVGAVLIGADFGQAAADRFPADGPIDRERDFADGHDVANRQFPGEFSRVAWAGCPGGGIISRRSARAVGPRTAA